MLIVHHQLLPSSFPVTLFRLSRNFGISLHTRVLLRKDEAFPANRAAPLRCHFSHCIPSRRRTSSKAYAGWFSGFSVNKSTFPEIIKAGDPVLHEPAGEVPLEEIGSKKIQKIIDDMIGAMRKAPGVGLAAPQIGIPLRIIVIEDTKEYISYAPRNVTKAQDRHPFDLLVIINPKLQKKGSKTAFFFEGCLSVEGFRAMVERHVEVEVKGYGRYGEPLKIDSAGWQARILQHECDHLDGIVYVDKIVPRTFRTVENLDLPIPVGCPKPGVYGQGEVVCED